MPGCAPPSMKRRPSRISLSRAANLLVILRSGPSLVGPFGTPTFDGAQGPVVVTQGATKNPRPLALRNLAGHGFFACALRMTEQARRRHVAWPALHTPQRRHPWVKT